MPFMRSATLRFSLVKNLATVAAMSHSITKAAAHWLRPDLIAWRVEHVEGVQYALLASNDGSLRLSTQVSVGDKCADAVVWLP